MTQVTGPGFSALPSELFFKTCNLLPYTEYPKLSCVCKNWGSQLNEKIWVPLKEINFPFPVQPQGSEKKAFSMQVILATFLQNNESFIDLIIDQIKDDKELALCLHMQTDEGALDKFKSQLPLERSRLVWKALFQDATPLLVKLVKQYDSGYMAHIKKCSEAPNYDINRAHSEYNGADQTGPIIKALTLQHKVPYDKAEVICALMPGFYVTPYAWELLCHIVKSHEDLSKLKERTCSNLGPHAGERIVADVVLGLCLQAQDTTVTMDDLARCKLVIIRQ